MHKVWDDGTEMFFLIRETDELVHFKDEALPPQPVTERQGITEAEWLELCKTHEPQATYENSEWGDGLPGAGAIWAEIPAADRK